MIFICSKWYLGEWEIDTICTQWIRKLKKIIVPHAKESLIGKFNPMDLCAFAYPLGMNVDSIKPNPCWLILDISF